VLDPNYRGSTGFSVIFREAIKKNGWGSDEQVDIRAGIEALIAAGIAEPGKVAITGTSFGGYSAQPSRTYRVNCWPPLHLFAA
jgi:dipeptidyl aminopeptidase/acylaminoacyl peptidase